MDMIDADVDLGTVALLVFLHGELLSPHSLSRLSTSEGNHCTAHPNGMGWYVPPPQKGRIYISYLDFCMEVLSVSPCLFTYSIINLYMTHGYLYFNWYKYV